MVEHGILNGAIDFRGSIGGRRRSRWCRFEREPYRLWLRPAARAPLENRIAFGRTARAPLDPSSAMMEPPLAGGSLGGHPEDGAAYATLLNTVESLQADLQQTITTCHGLRESNAQLSREHEARVECDSTARAG